jgi:LAO/AO transport system kinase
LGNAMKNIPAHHGVIKSKTERTRKVEVDPMQWTIPVLQTIAETAKGVPELITTLAQHRDWLSRTGELAERRRKRLKERVREAVERQLQGLVWRERAGERILEEAMADLEAGRATPYVVADRIVSTTTG